MKKAKFTLTPSQGSVIVSYDISEKDFIKEINRLEKDIKIKRKWWNKK